MSYINKIIQKVKNQADESDYRYQEFAWFNIIAHPIFYIIWLYLDKQGYENFYIRTVVILLNLPLIFINYWPHKSKNFIPIYWYLTITYCLPMFFSFMLLKNSFSFGWSLNSLTGLVLCILFLDYKSLSIIIPIGSVFGSFLYYLTTENPIFTTLHCKTIIITYSAVFIFGFLFLKRKELTHKAKYQSLNFQSGAIAHEMRTPLANVSMSAKIIEKVAFNMKKASTFNEDQKNQFLIEESQNLIDLSNRLHRIARGSQNFINLMLANLRQNFEDIPLFKLSMKFCLNKALEEYSFKSHEYEKIHVDIHQDFDFLGNEDLIIHIFFNLLKNSLYFIQSSSKGEIFISIASTLHTHQVIFKDTGPGIESHRLPYLFNPFFSKRPHGTGIGLSFCKKAMESMNGQIEVSSLIGWETTFVLSFAK